MGLRYARDLDVECVCMPDNELPFLKTDSILRNSRWPEPVRVLRLDSMGADYFTLHAFGLESGKHYSTILTVSDIEALYQQSSMDDQWTGDPNQLVLASESQRIKLAHLYDPLFAVSVSKIDLLPHQLEAVYGYMLPQPALRFLLADDPGAGKTIMAGLLLKELKLRGVVSRTLIVAPSPLRMQWQREMKEKFAEHFDLVDRAALNAMGAARTWRTSHQAIVSIDFAKQPDVLDSLAVADNWDLVIVDEAHKMAAYRRGPTKVERSARYRLGETLSEKAERLLLMTATPHKGDPENFRFLLSLVDADLFADQKILQRAVERQENPIFLRRLKENMRDFEGKPLFPPRHARTVAYQLQDAEWTLYEQVTRYVETNFNRALSDENRNVTFALIVLQRRLASSVRAVRRSLENRHARLVELRNEVLRDPELLEKAQAEPLDDFDNDDLTEDERWEIEQQALRYTVARNIHELEREIAQLEKLVELATAAEAAGPERKLRELQGVLHSLDLKQTGDKLLIFTEAKDTLDYLVENLHAWGFRTITIDGSMDIGQRIQSEQIFRSDEVQIMVATEAAGEGINLQFCHLMVNYDIPWNPTRIEQRLGRIHRYGQDREVTMVNLVANNTREGRVLEAVLLKLERMRREMGTDRVYDVVGEQLADAHLEDLIRDAVTKRRTFAEILASIDAAMPDNGAALIDQAALTSLVTPAVDLRSMAELRRRAEENRLSPAFIRDFFEDAMRILWPGRIDKRSDGYWRIRHVPADLRDIPPALATQYGQPDEQYLRFTFELADSRKTGAEFMGPGHPLFEAVLYHTRLRCQPDLERGAVFVDPDGRREGIIWLVEGTVNDGQGNIAGQKLFAVYQPADGGPLEWLPPGMLIDFEPVDSPGTVPDAIKALAGQRGAVIGWCIGQELEPYRQTLAERRQRETAIVRRYLQESFDVLIARSDGLLMRYEGQQDRGQDMRIKIAEEERRNTDLRRRKDQRLTRAEREQTLLLAEPRVLGMAAILSDVVSAEPARTGTTMRRDDEVEQAAIAAVLDYERRQGRSPEDLSPQKLPYDVRSMAPDGRIRYIEVKGRAGEGEVELSEREWLTAENMAEDYWLYIVSEALTRPQLHIVQDPANRLDPQAIIRRTRYHVTETAWRPIADNPPQE